MYTTHRIFVTFSIIISMLLLAGCFFHDPLPNPDRRAQGMVAGAVSGAAIATLSAPVTAPFGAVIGGIAGGAVGDYFGRQDTIELQLARQHVRLIKVGDEVKMILPTDVFFYPSSQELQRNYQSVLDLVARYMNQYQKTIVKVAGYTDNYGPADRNVALSNVRAQNLSHYLLLTNLDVRMLYVAGYGEQFPLAKNNSEKNRALNRRVEISFRIIHDV